MEVVRCLRESGATVKRARLPSLADQRVDAILDVELGDAAMRFAVEEKGRAPYPNELGRLRSRQQMLRSHGQPLLAAPFVPESLGSALVQSGWSWADAQCNFDLRAPGLVLRQRRTTAPPRPRRTSLPRGSGSNAIIRALIGCGEGEEEEAGVTSLAHQVTVSQPRVSQVLHQLAELGLVQRSERGRWVPHREALLDRFLAEYAGPGGSEQYLYSLDGPTAAATRAARSRTRRRRIVVSADVGPDLVAAWRRPSVVILYSDDEVPLKPLRLVEAQGLHDANVIVRNPDDRSVFPSHEIVVEVNQTDVALADPSQMLWDLEQLGGADRLEAAGKLREWLLKRH